MRVKGFEEVRDPIEGYRLTMCPECAAGYVERRRREEIGRLLDQAGVPARYQAATEAAVDRRLWAKVGAWRGAPEMLTLLGPTGSGKSMAAACLARVLLLDGKRCLWVRPMDAIADMRADLDSAHMLLRRLIDAPVLILDDLGTERLTDYALEQLVSLVFRRWDNLAPTVVTTNATPEQLHEISPKLASRLLGGLTCKVGGSDRRLAARSGGDHATQ